MMKEITVQSGRFSVARRPCRDRLNDADVLLQTAVQCTRGQAEIGRDVGRSSIPLATELGSLDHACLLISLGHALCTSRHRPKVLKREKEKCAWFARES